MLTFLKLNEEVSEAVQFATIPLVIFHKEFWRVANLAKPGNTREDFNLATIDFRHTGSCDAGLHLLQLSQINRFLTI